VTTEAEIQHYVDSPGAQANAAGRSRDRMVADARYWFGMWDKHVSAKP
jgi:hypothetical protein